VISETPWATAALPQRLFMGGAAVDLCVGPADPPRTKPVAGDMRVIAAPHEEAGTSIVEYLPVLPADRMPTINLPATYASGSGSVTFAHVAPAGAAVSWRKEDDDSVRDAMLIEGVFMKGDPVGHVVEMSFPLHPPILPRPGLRLRLDCSVLLADTEGEVCRKYGVLAEGEAQGARKSSVGHATFVIDKKGILRHAFYVTDKTLTDHYYYLTVDGETTLKISHDYELTGSDDIMLETPLQPFIDAGLDVSKLGNGYKVSDHMLYLTADYGNGDGMTDTITDSLFESVKPDRSVLTYHQKLDHYGIKLTAGKFEWAKDYTANDKDIVFVIKAQPLKDLGADVNNISGWTFTTVQDTDGSNVDVLLKAYDLDVK
jgi:hypothetical protein